MPQTTSEDERPRHAVAMRRRIGRGGRMHYDRRILLSQFGRPTSPEPTAEYFNRRADFPDRESDLSVEERDYHVRRLSERWRFDQDDSPPVVPEGPEELDRALIDDYDPK